MTVTVTVPSCPKLHSSSNLKLSCIMQSGADHDYAFYAFYAWWDYFPTEMWLSMRHGHGHGHGIFMRSMRSMRVGFIFRNMGPSLRYIAASVSQAFGRTQHDAGESPQSPGAASFFESQVVSLSTPVWCKQRIRVSDILDYHNMQQSERHGTAAVTDTDMAHSA
jgi:hypothetical protein